MNTALNYQPEVLVDTADLSREDWLDYRYWWKRCSGNHGLIPIFDNQGFVFR